MHGLGIIRQRDKLIHYTSLYIYIYGFLSILVRHQLLFETFQTLVLHLKSVLQAHAMACAKCTTSPASVNEPGVHIVLGHPWMDLSGLGNYNMEHHCEVCWNKAGQMKEVRSRNLKKARVGKDWYSKGWGKQSHIDPKQIKTRTYMDTYGTLWYLTFECSIAMQTWRQTGAQIVIHFVLPSKPLGFAQGLICEQFRILGRVPHHERRTEARGESSRRLSYTHLTLGELPLWKRKT